MEKLKFSYFAKCNLYGSANYMITLENNLVVLNSLSILLPYDSADLPVGI